MEVSVPMEFWRKSLRGGRLPAANVSKIRAGPPLGGSRLGAAFFGHLVLVEAISSITSPCGRGAAEDAMKKRTLKTLSLKRETIALLRREQMSKVDGAATMAACCYNSDSCPPNTGPCSLACPSELAECV